MKLVEIITPVNWQISKRGQSNKMGETIQTGKTSKRGKQIKMVLLVQHV